MGRHSFLGQLRRLFPGVRHLPADQRKTLSIQASFGDYQVEIGPEYTLSECRERGFRPHSRPVELHARFDHLVVEGSEVRAYPSSRAVDGFLRTAVIIHGVVVHLIDPEGCGTIQEDADPQFAQLEYRDLFAPATPNPAGHIQRLQAAGQLLDQTYQLIQTDLLRSCRHLQIRGRELDA